MLELLLLAVLLFCVIIVVLLFSLSSKLGQNFDSETLKGAVATSWKELGVDQDIGEIKSKANEIQYAAQDLQTLFKVTRGRGEFGEFQLDQILHDLLPSKYVHIRERLAETGRTPDAHIVTPKGTVCIDSKFPLENYRRMVASTDRVDKHSYGQLFCRDVENHLNKIKTDYVRPEYATTPFAFGFIPSEAVYQYLTECHPHLVANAAKDGVLVVSPATLSINLNLMSMALKATEIAENAQQIQNNLSKLSKSINEVQESWNTLYNHIKNTYNKASDFYDKQNRLKTNFEQITEKEPE